MSSQALEIDNLSDSKVHVDGIAPPGMFLAPSVGKVFDIRASVDDAFGEEESSRKLEVVAGRSHRYAHGGAVQADFQRFLSDHLIEPAALRASIPLNNWRRL